MLSFQLFWIVICPPNMLLAAVVRERECAEAALQYQRNQLAHVTRVATVGELSGAIAHELRQPLSAILANAQAGILLLKRDSVDAAEIREILADIAQQDEQADHVITRLRSFLKDGAARRDQLTIETVVRDALALTHGAIVMARVEVETELAPDLPYVRGDAVQLLQVMVNLIVNACDAMQAAPAHERRLRVVVTRAGPQHVEVVVVDRGTGLSSGSEEKVFDPFFTTKTDGLGLGLAICRSIVTAHRGRLWAENAAERGAAFHLVLPF